MKKLLVVTFFILVFSNSVLPQWQSIGNTPGYSNPTYNCSWNSLSAIASNYRIYWAYSAECSIPGGMGQFSEYEIFGSADLGSSWFSKTYQNSAIIGLVKMDFISGDTGYFVHNTNYFNSHLFRTSDYLTNYQPCYSAENLTFRDLDMLSYNDLYIIDTESKILHLKNDTLHLIYDLPVELKEWGEDPTISATPGHNLFILCKSYPNDIYENDLILNSYDGGYSWDTSFISSTNHLNSLVFATDNLGFAIGDNGVVMRTQNAGLTWENMTSGTENDLLSIDFMNEQTWLMGGTNATLLLTEDGGETWEVVYLPPSIYSVVGVKFPEKDEIVFIKHLGIKRASIYNVTKVPSRRINSKHYNLYPNPAKHHFTLQLKDPELQNIKVEILDLKGDKVYQSIIRNSEQIIDCRTLSQGMYILKISNSNNIFVEKLLIQ